MQQDVACFQYVLSHTHTLWWLQDIGGLDIQKQEVREAVELPLTHFDLYKQIGIDPPRGVRRVLHLQLQQTPGHVLSL